MKRIVPSPPLSGTLFVVWLLLNQSLHATTLLLGAVLAIVVPLITQGLRPATVRMRKPGVALRLARDAIVDMFLSAINVVRLAPTRRNSHLIGYIVQIPLELSYPNGVAVLAMITCLTPGTAWAELSFDRSTLLIHVFDLMDEQQFIENVKQRYELPLLEIFQ